MQISLYFGKRSLQNLLPLPRYKFLAGVKKEVGQAVVVQGKVTRTTAIWEPRVSPCLPLGWKKISEQRKESQAEEVTQVTTLSAQTTKGGRIVSSWKLEHRNLLRDKLNHQSTGHQLPSTLGNTCTKETPEGNPRTTAWCGLSGP